eukprot:CAMPEP_0174926304 /NCGR_PEP_ID=MMETSP1355-20121228/11104_1 /TAXON_ID=464990 /ORGANISM="Hemiselmis tepida, Strain CCMP443" /LENGTH=59 /DNA_ID=CAMNT_0016172331 /DNA_START=13 /DNA_END=192 /DNA_ORIENTATION=+
MHSCLWNAAINDTIKGPAAASSPLHGLHNTSWLWTHGSQLEGNSLHQEGGPRAHTAQFH